MLPLVEVINPIFSAEYKLEVRVIRKKNITTTKR